MQSLKKLSTMKLVVNERYVGRVVQGVLSDDLLRLEGIWADPGIGGLRFIEWDKICTIGSKSIIAEDTGAHLRIRPRSLFIRAVSAEGIRLGAIVDAMIDRTSLNVRCLMLAEGYWEYLLKGAAPVFHFRHDRKNRRVIVSADAADNSEQEVLL